MNIDIRHHLSPAAVGHAIAKRSEAHYAVLEVNFLTRGLWRGEAAHDRLVAGIDAAVAALSVGKFKLGRAIGDLAGLSKPSWSEADLVGASEAFEDAMRIADAVTKRQRPGDLMARYTATPLPGTELLACQGIPIVPSISPIVVLRGTSRQMGAQYMHQALDIFGAFVFSGYTDRHLNAQQVAIIDRWAQQLEAHAPDTLDYAMGMSEAAQARGVPMTRHEALAMWTGIEAPPRTIQGFQSMAYFGMTEEAPDHCSGACAWGHGTVDGELYLSATTDHDCTFQATVVAYPADGNAFIYTPFSVNGFTTFVGEAWFAGHPGINSQGLAYVQHGAGCEGSPINDNWGYGVRRGATTFDILRHQSTARDALAHELSLPLGDGASVLGTAGGFYADKDFGYVIESREPTRGPVVREHTYDRSGRALDVLYANNNNIDPRSGDHWCPPKAGYAYELEAGWFTMEEPAPDAAMGEIMRQITAKSSEGRNRYFHQKLTEAYGDIDLNTMVAMYQTGPQYPELPWREIEEMCRKGHRFEGSSAGHRRNAFTAAATPRNDGTGVYKGGIGPITHRSAAPQRVSHGYIYYDETNEMWELSLPKTLDELLPNAWAVASSRLSVARDHVSAAEPSQRATLNVVLDGATSRIKQASGGGTDDVSAVAAALRNVTAAQVRAAQAISAATRGTLRGS